MYWSAVNEVSGLDFTTNSTSLVDITGFTFAALANSKYEVEAMLLGQSSTTSGVQFAVSYSAAGATGSYLAFSPSSSAGSSGGVNQIGTATGVSVWTAAVTDLHTYIKAIIRVGANTGNISVQVKVIGPTTATIHTGSVMKVRQL